MNPMIAEIIELEPV